jgi:antitoxin VapB
VRKRRQSPVSAGEAAAKRERIRRFLEDVVWPTIPKRFLGKRITKKEREAILGYGPRGV